MVTGETPASVASFLIGGNVADVIRPSDLAAAIRESRKRIARSRAGAARIYNPHAKSMVFYII
jgi:hypothetical protein